MTTILTQARDLVRHLSTQEKLYLLSDITTQLIQEASHPSAQQRASFPVFQEAQWSTDIPLRREELYNDRGR